ncbi:MAG TPA: hypothetical protein VH854_00640 [Thermoanaerobaculia bacterium]|nr:hypothetical protein [Thermoanaerobaculia bacterium]
MRLWPVARIALVAALLAVTAYGGINDGLSTLRKAKTPGESAAVAVQIAYGGLSVAALLAMALRPRWVTALLIAWGVAVTATGTVAPVVWGGAGWGAGAAGGAATAAVAWLEIAGWRAHARWRGAAAA